MGVEVEFAESSPLQLRTVPILTFTGEALLVWGGFVAGLWYFADGAHYDLASGSWSRLPDGPLAGRVRAATAWTGSELLIAGGAGANWAVFADGAAFDPSHWVWRPLPPLPDGGRRLSTSCWTGDRLVIFGGYDPDGTPAPAVIALDPTASEWEARAFDPIGRNPTPAVVWDGTRCIAWGGYEPDSVRPSLYDPQRDEWRVGAPAPLQPRVGHIAIPIAGRVLVWGGEVHDRGFADGAWYNPTADTWEPIAPAPAAKPHARAVVIARQLVVFGGNVSDRDVNILTYHLDYDRWDEANVPFWPGSGNAVATLSPERVAVWSGFERNPSDLAFLIPT